MRAGVIQIVAITDQLQMGYQRGHDRDPARGRRHRVGGPPDQCHRQVDYLVATAGRVDLFAGGDRRRRALYDVVTRIRAVPGYDMPSYVWL